MNRGAEGAWPRTGTRGHGGGEHRTPNAVQFGRFGSMTRVGEEEADLPMRLMERQREGRPAMDSISLVSLFCSMIHEWSGATTVRLSLWFCFVSCHLEGLAREDRVLVIQFHLGNATIDGLRETRGRCLASRRALLYARISQAKDTCMGCVVRAMLCFSVRSRTS